MRKKSGQSTDAKKKLRRKNRQSRAQGTEGDLLHPGSFWLTTPGADHTWGRIQFAPTMTVTEFLRRAAAGARIDPKSVDFTDPNLGRIFSGESSRWRDCGDPLDSLWFLEYSKTLGESLVGLQINLESGVDGPRWCVYYPSLDESAREPDEVYESRADLLAELDRLEARWTVSDDG